MEHQMQDNEIGLTRIDQVSQSDVPTLANLGT